MNRKKILWLISSILIFVSIVAWKGGAWDRLRTIYGNLVVTGSVAIDKTVPLKVDALGTPALNATATFDLQVGTVTIANNCIIDLTDWPASGYEGKKTLYLTNGGAATITWKSKGSAVTPDYVGGSAPSFTAAGLDIIVLASTDGGTTVNLLVAGQDVK